MALRRSSINYLIPPSGNLKFLLKKTTSCLSWNGVGNLISPWVYKREEKTNNFLKICQHTPAFTSTRRRKGVINWWLKSIVVISSTWTWRLARWMTNYWKMFFKVHFDNVAMQIVKVIINYLKGALHICPLCCSSERDYFIYMHNMHSKSLQKRF